MSAPQTNIERQKRRHRGPIAGISAGLAIVLLLVLGYGWLGGSAENPSVAEPETAIPATEPMADPSAAPATDVEEQVAPAD